MKRGIFGGTFDPIHYAHLLLADGARETCSLDKVLFVPAGIPPHKVYRDRVNGQDRCQMLTAAIEPWSEFELERFEVDTPGISFTIRTVEYLEQKYPGDEFYLIIGSETLADLSHWYEPERLCSKVHLAVAHRFGYPSPDFSPLMSFVPAERIKKWEKNIIAMPQMGISSTLIRERLSAGKSIRFLTPPAVENFIAEHHLYQ